MRKVRRIQHALQCLPLASCPGLQSTGGFHLQVLPLVVPQPRLARVKAQHGEGVDHILIKRVVVAVDVVGHLGGGRRHACKPCLSKHRVSTLNSVSSPAPAHTLATPTLVSSLQ